MKTVYGKNHFNRWNSKVLELELQLLAKEFDHLSRKVEERGLTEWEEERIVKVQKERRRITYRINSGSFDRSKFERI